MKKLVFAIATVAVVAVTAVAGAYASGGSTVIDRGFACALLDGDGNVIVTNYSVLTLYSSGKLVLQCEASEAGNSTRHLVNWNYANTGLLCMPAGTSPTPGTTRSARTAARS